MFTCQSLEVLLAFKSELFCDFFFNGMENTY
jgi:hypothetical protein